MPSKEVEIAFRKVDGKARPNKKSMDILRRAFNEATGMNFQKEDLSCNGCAHKIVQFWRNKFRNI